MLDRQLLALQEPVVFVATPTWILHAPRRAFYAPWRAVAAQAAMGSVTVDLGAGPLEADKGA